MRGQVAIIISCLCGPCDWVVDQPRVPRPPPWGQGTIRTRDPSIKLFVESSSGPRMSPLSVFPAGQAQITSECTSKGQAGKWTGMLFYWGAKLEPHRGPAFLRESDSAICFSSVEAEFPFGAKNFLEAACPELPSLEQAADC